MRLCYSQTPEDRFPCRGSVLLKYTFLVLFEIFETFLADSDWFLRSGELSFFVGAIVAEYVPTVSTMVLKQC